MPDYTAKPLTDNVSRNQHNSNTPTTRQQHDNNTTTARQQHEHSLNGQSAQPTIAAKRHGLERGRSARLCA
jgi:hypothetical protein